MTVSRGKSHTFLGMELDFSDKGKLHIRQKKHLEDMVKAFPVKIETTDMAATPTSNILLGSSESKLLNEKGREDFHTCVAKGIFIAKRSRPNIQPTISVLSSRVHNPYVQNLEKLVRLCKYLNLTKYLHLVLLIDDKKLIILWYIDASYAMHKDFCSHSGLVTKFSQGSAISSFLKQKLNTHYSMEAELVELKILWP